MAPTGEARSGRGPLEELAGSGRTFEEYRDSLAAWAVRAKEIGFTAAKLEVTLSGPYNHSGLQEPDERVTEVVAACRSAVGREFTLMVGVRLARCRDRPPDRPRLEGPGPLLPRDPLPIDDLAGYARLHREAPVRIAAGEWQNTRFEFADLLDVALIDVAQPDVGRVGGLTEARRVCDMAAARGRIVVPHCWKTGIGIAASAHLAAVTPHCPYIEFLPADLCDSLLRKGAGRGRARDPGRYDPAPAEAGARDRGRHEGAPEVRGRGMRGGARADITVIHSIDVLALEEILLERIGRRPRGGLLDPVLVIVPTRELAAHLKRRIAGEYGAALGVHIATHRQLAIRAIEGALEVPPREVPRAALASLVAGSPRTSRARMASTSAPAPGRGRRSSRPSTTSATRA
jgi:hypothetical protein